MTDDSVIKIAYPYTYTYFTFSYNLASIIYHNNYYQVLAKIIDRLFHEKSTKQPYRSQGNTNL